MQTNHICGKTHYYQTPLFLFRGLCWLGCKHALLKPGSTAVCSYRHIPTSATTTHEAQRNTSWCCQCLRPPLALPRGTFSNASGHSAACLAPTYSPGARRSHSSVLPGSPEKINSFPEAGVMACVSAKASLSTFPDLQMGEASRRSWKSQEQSITIGQNIMEKQKLSLWCLVGCLFRGKRERKRFVHTPPAPRSTPGK